MKMTIKILTALCLAAVIAAVSCKKKDYSFGQIVTPTDITLTTEIEGVNGANPNGGGSGNVTITTKAVSAVSYKIDYGDGTTETGQGTGVQ